MDWRGAAVVVMVLGGGAQCRWGPVRAVAWASAIGIAGMREGLWDVLGWELRMAGFGSDLVEERERTFSRNR